MEWMILDDGLSIFAFVMLAGLGIGAFLIIMFLYINLLRVLEDLYD